MIGFLRNYKYMKNIAVIVCLVLGLCGCGTKQADNSLVLNFEGRSIDIAPYFKDFPYSIFTISKDGSKLLFSKREKNRLFSGWTLLRGQICVRLKMWLM